MLLTCILVWTIYFVVLVHAELNVTWIHHNHSSSGSGSSNSYSGSGSSSSGGGGSSSGGSSSGGGGTSPGIGGKYSWYSLYTYL